MKNCYRGAVAAALLLLLAPAAPAATKSASSITTSSFRYEGRTITAGRAAAEGLVCTVRRDGRGRCVDRKPTASRSLVPPGPHCLVTTYMSLFQDTFYGGWEVRLSTRDVWYDLPAAYDNQASSFRMGNRSGHIASEKYVNGLGFLYPGPTGNSDCAPQMSAYKYKDTTWNNKASAMYRN
jgi:hypothetical protein